jgi:hypothetical protein
VSRESHPLSVSLPPHKLVDEAHGYECMALLLIGYAFFLVVRAPDVTAWHKLFIVTLRIVTTQTRACKPVGASTAKRMMSLGRAAAWLGHGGGACFARALFTRKLGSSHVSAMAHCPLLVCSYAHMLAFSSVSRATHPSSPNTLCHTDYSLGSPWPQTHNLCTPLGPNPNPPW